jgi:hypothetical protein
VHVVEVAYLFAVFVRPERAADDNLATSEARGAASSSS